MEQLDRREEIRVIFRTTTQLTFKDKEFKDCETKDVSITGALILGVEGPEAGEQCDIVLKLSGSTSDLLLKMKGEVIRTTQEGLAVQFFDVNHDSFCHLKNIVYYNYKHPEELEEESPLTKASTKKPRKPSEIKLDNIDDNEIYLSDDDDFDDNDWDSDSSDDDDLYDD